MALRCHVDDLAASTVRLRPLREDGLLEPSGSAPYQHDRWRRSEELAVWVWIRLRVRRSDGLGCQRRFVR